jgi:hypothetical protein
VKEQESNFGSVVGGDGALYAIRRELYEPLRPTDINDLLHPLQIILKRFRGVYEPAAVCHETAGDSFEKEFRRKVRIVSRSFNAVRRAWPVLLPWNQFPHWMCLVSHKILRWTAPFFLFSPPSPSICFGPMSSIGLPESAAAFYALAHHRLVYKRQRPSARLPSVLLLRRKSCIFPWSSEILRFALIHVANGKA